MKALIIYGTRYGTATGIAEEIAKVLKDENVEVDLVNAREVKNSDITPYDLVVVGSGIKMGKWTKDTLKFLEKNRENLTNKKVAIFVTCGAANKKETIQEGQEKYLDDVAAKYLINPPVSTGLFGSLYDPKGKHGLMYKVTNRFLRKEVEKEGKDPNKRWDYRNWDEIRIWAKNLVN